MPPLQMTDCTLSNCIMARKSTKKGASSTDDEPIGNAPIADGKSGTSDSSEMAVDSTLGAPAEAEYKGIPQASKKSSKVPTVNDILADPITQLASEHWASKTKVRMKLVLCKR